MGEKALDWMGLWSFQILSPQYFTDFTVLENFRDWNLSGRSKCSDQSFNVCDTVSACISHQAEIGPSPAIYIHFIHTHNNGIEFNVLRRYHVDMNRSRLIIMLKDNSTSKIELDSPRQYCTVCTCLYMNRWHLTKLRDLARTQFKRSESFGKSLRPKIFRIYHNLLRDRAQSFGFLR